MNYKVTVHLSDDSCWEFSGQTAVPRIGTAPFTLADDENSVEFNPAHVVAIEAEIEKEAAEPMPGFPPGMSVPRRSFIAKILLPIFATALLSGCIDDPVVATFLDGKVLTCRSFSICNCGANLIECSDGKTHYCATNVAIKRTAKIGGTK